jgi:hypothetical protein
MSDAARVTASPVAEYKQLLQAVLENRPSGTRQRLARALGTNRSFASQISNPTYPMPIPAQHVDTILEICHFSQAERVAFLAAYARAHPGRREARSGAARMRVVDVSVPDLGSPRKNRLIDQMVAEFARQIGRLADDLAS